MFRRVTIRKVSFLGTVVIILVLTASLGGFWIRGIYLNFDAQVAALEKELLRSRREVIRHQVEEVVEYIGFRRKQALGKVRETLRQRVLDAHALTTNIYKEYQGKLTGTEIRRMVAAKLSEIRFDGGRGYYFATTGDDGREIIADHPEVAGRQLIKVPAVTEEIPGKSMIGFVTGKEEGFYNYEAPKPGRPGEDVPKLSFVQYFEPFEWYVGTGVYLDDIQRQDQNEILERTYGMRQAEDRDFLIFRYDGTILFHGKTQLIGRNILSMADAGGHEIYRDILATCVEKGEGFFDYHWTRPETEQVLPKICYARTYGDWQWIIATDMYVNDIEAVLQQKKSELTSQVNQNLARILLVLAGSIGIVLLLSQYFSRKLAEEFNEFLAFFRDSATTYGTIDTGRLKFLEFRRLADSANRMIEDRKEAEHALRVSEEKFRTLFELAPDGIAITTLDGEMLSFNSAFVHIIKYDDPNSLAGLNARELYEHHEGRSEMIERLASRGRLEDYQTNLVDASGEVFTASLSLRLIQYEGRSCILSIIRDITPIKKMEADLKGYAENLERMVEEKTSELRDANAELTLAITSLEETRKQLALSAHQAGMAEIAASILHNIGNAITSVIVRAHTVAKRGLLREIKLLEKTSAFLQSETTRADGAVEAKDAEKLVLLLAATIELLKEKDQSSKADLEFMMRGLDHVAEIIALQQRYTGLRGHETLVDINQLLKDAIEMLEDSLVKRGITIELDLRDLPPLFLDKNKIIQIFINIIKNGYEAIDAGPSGARGRIRVSTSVIEHAGGASAEVVVADTGVGISEQDREKVFRFSYSTKERKTGFGLHDAANYINGQGGSIHLLSDGPGKGAQSVIRLPVPTPPRS